VWGGVCECEEGGVEGGEVREEESGEGCVRVSVRKEEWLCV
jgi:hypothetical protein